jgi:hypothetical protein
MSGGSFFIYACIFLVTIHDHPIISFDFIQYRQRKKYRKKHTNIQTRGKDKIQRKKEHGEKTAASI